MRAKSKKVLKTLGVGALCLCGALIFSGCSMDLSQDQIDKLMFAVDNSQEFMQDTLDLLEKQNDKMDAEQAYKMYRYAVNKFYLNLDGVRDNILIQVTGNDYSQIILTYKNSESEAILEVSDDEEKLFFTQNGVNYTSLGTTGEGVVLGKILLDKDINSNMDWYSMDISRLTGIELNLNHIVSCNILANGNYELIAVIENNEAQNQINSLFTLEFTTEGLLVKENLEIVKNNIFEERQTYEITFNYNCDNAYVENLLNQALNAPIADYRVLSSSMSPVLEIGDYITVDSKGSYIVGDIIKFACNGLPVVHRIIGIVEDSSTGKTYYVCKGDAVGSANPANNGQVVDWQEDSVYVSTLTYEQIKNAYNIQVIELSQIEGVVTKIA